MGVPGGGGGVAEGKQSQSGNIRFTVGQYWLIAAERSEAASLSCIITGGPAPILRSVNQVKPKTWRIFRQNDAISMTTGP
jgi:hypothetical protein